MEGINNGMPYINGKLYDWGDIVLALAGVPVTGIVGIDYKDEQDMKTLYGAGRFPVGYACGQITAEGELELYQEEVEALQSVAPNGRLQDIPPFNITVSYMPQSGIVKTDKLRNCKFKNNGRTWKAGQTGSTVKVKLLMSHIEWDKKK